MRASSAPLDQTARGLNFRTLRPRRDILADQRTIVAEISDQGAYSGVSAASGGCLTDFARRPARAKGRSTPGLCRRRRSPLRRRKAQGPHWLLYTLLAAIGLGGVSAVELQIVVRSLSQVAMRDPRLLWAICRTVADCLMHNPSAFQAVMRMCIFYLHMGPFARRVVAEMDCAIAWEDAHPGWQRLALLVSPSAADIGPSSESSHAGQPVG